MGWHRPSRQVTIGVPPGNPLNLRDESVKPPREAHLSHMRMYRRQPSGKGTGFKSLAHMGILGLDPNALTPCIKPKSVRSSGPHFCTTRSRFGLCQACTWPRMGPSRFQSGAPTAPTATEHLKRSSRVCMRQPATQPTKRGATTRMPRPTQRWKPTPSLLAVSQPARYRTHVACGMLAPNRNPQSCDTIRCTYDRTAWPSMLQTNTPSHRHRHATAVPQSSTCTHHATHAISRQWHCYTDVAVDLRLLDTGGRHACGGCPSQFATPNELYKRRGGPRSIAALLTTAFLHNLRLLQYPAPVQCLHPAQFTHPVPPAKIEATAASASVSGQQYSARHSATIPVTLGTQFRVSCGSMISRHG